MNKETSQQRFVWFALVDHNGEPYKQTRTSRIAVDNDVIVAEFRNIVFHDIAIILQGVVPSQFRVYSNRVDFEQRKDPLKSSLQINGLGITEDDALIVKIPSPVLDENTTRIEDPSRLLMPPVDKGWTSKWLDEFHKSQISTHDLPLVGNLVAFLESELPVKIAIHSLILKSWRIKMDFSSPDLMEKLFVISDSEPCIYFLNKVINRIVDTVDTLGASESSFISFWDDMISNVLNNVCFGKSRRNECHTASTSSKCPDFMFIVDSVCVFRGEELAPKPQNDTPFWPSIMILHWNYGDDVPYLFGYAAVGSKIRLYAITRRPMLRGYITDSKPLGVFNLCHLSERLRLFLALLNISRLLRSIARLCPESGRAEYFTIHRRNGIRIELEQTRVVKYYPETLFHHALSQANLVYTILDTNDIPNVDFLDTVDPSRNRLIFQPRGDDQKPKTLAELFRALQDIFQALIKLHEVSWMHRDIRWANVMKRRDGSDSWFLIDFMDAAQSPQWATLGKQRQLSQSEHAPEIFDSDKHTVAVDIWSMGYLILTSGSKVSENWYDLGRERTKFLDSLMDKDPSKRPNAATALDILKRLEKQYQTQQH